jgi:hypothetical protein
MAITQVANPSSVPSAVADYEAQNAHISAFNNIVNNQPFILTNSGGTGLPAIKLGTYIQYGGNLYVVDTEDYAIIGTPVDGNNYIRLSGSTTLTAEWVQNISSYVWNEVYGYKESGSYFLLPYLVLKDGASYHKYSLMQQNKRITGDLSVSGDVGSATSTTSGNATVGGTLGVTGALSAPTLNTGQGANELYAMNQNVRTTDQVTFAKLKLTTSTYGSLNVARGGTWVVPAGIYIFLPASYSSQSKLQIWNGSSWVERGNAEDVIISDGSNIRIRNTNTDYVNAVRYRKFS